MHQVQMRVNFKEAWSMLLGMDSLVDAFLSSPANDTGFYNISKQALLDISSPIDWWGATNGPLISSKACLEIW